MELVKILLGLFNKPKILELQEIAIRKQFEEGYLNPQEIIDNYKKLSWKERNLSFNCGTEYLKYAVANNYQKEQLK